MSLILYFVGAGLTKALAKPTHPVPAMFDFVSTCAEYVVDDEVILTTLAELERCEPYPYRWYSRAATQVASKLLDQKRRNGTTEYSARHEFARALRERPGESIETLLDSTGRDSSNSSSRSADERFRFAIRRLLTLVGWDIEWCPLISFLTRQFTRADTNHTFVSFNYDLVLERAIQRVNESKVDLTRMYGFPIAWQATGEPIHPRSGVPVLPLNDSGVHSHLSVLKPHGSLNWLAPMAHCDKSKTDDLRQGRTVIIALGENGVLHYPPYYPLPSGDLAGCEQVQLPSELSGGLIGATMEMEPVIVTPRGTKRPDRQFLRDVREQEETAIRTADEVYVLGWSIPRTDADQECLIRSMVGKRTAQFQHVTIINLHADVGYYDRVQDIFGVERSVVETHNEGFGRFAATG